MDLYSTISHQAMLHTFNCTPCGFQLVIIPHLLKMQAGTIPCQPVLMVQPTGSGKPSVPLTYSVVDGGLTIIIENTLALGTNQSTKLKSIASSTSRCYVKSIHLDSVKKPCQQTPLSKATLKHLQHNHNTSLIVFTSPETLLKSVWIKFVLKCNDLGFLKLICIDEIHIFVHCGSSFCSCFQLLNEELFSKVKINNMTSSIPLLTMTATFNT